MLHDDFVPPCAEVGGDEWFPEKGEQALPAKAICRRCELRDPCLLGAVDRNEHFGVWGGINFSSSQMRAKARLVAQRLRARAGELRRRGASGEFGAGPADEPQHELPHEAGAGGAELVGDLAEALPWGVVDLRGAQRRRPSVPGHGGNASHRRLTSSNEATGRGCA